MLGSSSWAYGCGSKINFGHQSESCKNSHYARQRDSGADILRIIPTISRFRRLAELVI